jgi:hypothetical protein
VSRPQASPGPDLHRAGRADAGRAGAPPVRDRHQRGHARRASMSTNAVANGMGLAVMVA